MKKTIASLAAVAAVAAVAAPAAAQPYAYGHDRHDRYERDDWQPINQRQAQLERRIDRGIQRGELTRREAARLQAEFHRIARLEARYRVNGLSGWERADLDRRFDRLAAQIRYERRDHQQYGWR